MQTFFTLFQEEKPTAVALGFFDGVHRGHRKVLSGAARQKKNGLFDKLAALRQIGIEHVFFADFRALMHLSARAFFEQILVGRLRAKALFCGFNYRFGKNAEGDVTLLQKLCVEHHIALTVVPPETDGGEVVCSTLIRRLIAEGNIRRANSMLSGTFGVREAILQRSAYALAPSVERAYAEWLPDETDPKEAFEKLLGEPGITEDACPEV